MSFPDPTPPPFNGGDGGGFWPAPFMIGNEQQYEFEHRHNSPQFKRQRHSERPPPQNTSRVNPSGGPGSRGISHLFYKTRICAKFMDGMCRNGEHCTFAHGAQDLRNPPHNWQELVREKERSGVSGSGWGDDPRAIHGMKICKKYYNGEECPYGDKCNFLHKRGPTPSQPPAAARKFKADVPGQRESVAISIGTTDRGTSGGGVDQGVFWKTRLCSKWEMGQCPFGEHCHYAHGQSELKVPPAIDEPEMAVPMNAGTTIPRKPVSAFPTAHPNTVVGAPLNTDADQQKASKWKLSKKVNRIYADWLDDMSPPRGALDDEGM